jgi:hypothetical protein
MNPKEIKWLKACQAWHFQEALRWIGKQTAPASLPFKQPEVDYNGCLRWYRQAIKWQEKINQEETDVEASMSLPPPPPKPPGLKK